MENMKVYNAKDGKKAIDMTDLNSWIDARIEGSNPLTLNIADIPDSIKEYRGLVAWGILVELNEFLRKNLGLAQEVVEVVEQKQEVEVRENPKVKAQIKPPMKKVAEAQPEEQVDDSTEDMITLDEE